MVCKTVYDFMEITEDLTELILRRWSHQSRCDMWSV